MGLLDDAIKKETVASRNLRTDRVIAALNAHPRAHKPDDDSDDPRTIFDRLLDLLAARKPTNKPGQEAYEFGHKAAAGIVVKVCADFEIDHEGLNEDDVARWRESERQQRGSS